MNNNIESMRLEDNTTTTYKDDPKMFLCWLITVFPNEHVINLNIEQVISAYNHACSVGHPLGY